MASLQVLTDRFNTNLPRQQQFLTAQFDKKYGTKTMVKGPTQAFTMLIHGMHYNFNDVHEPILLNFAQRSRVTIIQLGQQDDFSYGSPILPMVYFCINKYGVAFLEELEHALELKGFDEKYEATPGNEISEKIFEIFSSFEAIKLANTYHSSSYFNLYSRGETIQNLSFSINEPFETLTIDFDINQPEHYYYYLYSNPSAQNWSITDQDGNMQIFQATVPMGIYHYTKQLNIIKRFRDKDQRFTLRQVCKDLRTVYPNGKIYLFLEACKSSADLFPTEKVVKTSLMFNLGKLTVEETWPIVVKRYVDLKDPQFQIAEMPSYLINEFFKDTPIKNILKKMFKNCFVVKTHLGQIKVSDLEYNFHNKNNVNIIILFQPNPENPNLIKDIKIQGFCFLQKKNDDTLYIHTLCVNKNARSQGVCNKMISFITTKYGNRLTSVTFNLELHVRGPHTLFTQVDKFPGENIGAFKCYYKNGFLFKRVGQTMIAPDGINFIMHRPKMGIHSLTESIFKDFHKEISDDEKLLFLTGQKVQPSDWKRLIF